MPLLQTLQTERPMIHKRMGSMGWGLFLQTSCLHSSLIRSFVDFKIILFVIYCAILYLCMLNPGPLDNCIKGHFWIKSILPSSTEILHFKTEILGTIKSLSVPSLEEFSIRVGSCMTDGFALGTYLLND